ncbi:FAD synthetase family protein [Bacillus badius]|uniref:FAD synthetase family protein n=1 Tax=Bacillus badius TaxID=1455 RepID=UPI0007B0A3F1|nr:FAD synthetase family protein [Bacillus badius]KZO00732.1 FAD synthetase [Bacillus badius]MED0667038.1 FAD synthetase family protein [Bacillus badius]OCS88146.1 FAD synthetase [Bacillus badius]OVE53327.1 FAD synthetase [Bacillus badius]TDW05672.1 riboflavin kinase/FMN adenylyltransferase [Bacillus badius]
MEVIKNNSLHLKQSIVTIGAFDGIHIGHQSLIKKAVRRARQCNISSVVYTFDPPPRAFFQNQMVLTSVEEKVHFLKKLGIDYVIVARFDKDYLAKSAGDFLKELEALSPKEIWVGPNFQFGKGKRGTTEDLAARFHTFIHPLVKCANGQTVSSTRIRNLLHQQKEHLANELLGRELFASV